MKTIERDILEDIATDIKELSEVISYLRVQPELKGSRFHEEVVVPLYELLAKAKNLEFGMIGK